MTTETKLCKDCAYIKGGSCSIEYTCPIDGKAKKYACFYARHLFCGASAKHFKPREIKDNIKCEDCAYGTADGTCIRRIFQICPAENGGLPRNPDDAFAAWKKAHAGQWVTDEEWDDAGGSLDDIKGVDHSHTRHRPGGLQVHLDANGEIPKRDWRLDIPWGECPDAEKFAFDGNAIGWFYGKMERGPFTWLHAPVRSSFSKPDHVDWRESLTLRPGGK
jgi:hypothetical protein